MGEWVGAWVGAWVGGDVGSSLGLVVRGLRPAYEYEGMCVG